MVGLQKRPQVQITESTLSLTFWRRKKQTQHIFIHSIVPSVESGKAERSGAENEPRDFSLTFFDTKKEAKKYSPLQGLPAGGGCKQIIAARRRLFLCFGIAGRRDLYYIGWRMEKDLNNLKPLN